MMPTNAGRVMLPLNSLLNPAPPNRPAPQSRQSSPALSSLSASATRKASRVATDGAPTSKGRLPRNANIMTKTKPQGPINFTPFEDVDQASFQELSRFRVSPFGQIQQCCEHIPYNSAKKDFFEKTGRESIEVFKYDFRLPGEDFRYTIMWDYNVGLVRMTPFFKCLGYPKTKPSQMLDKNPGLRELSPSVTGGAVSAQGYWMPYRCAKAICATFCYRIAGALIPLFGPAFPSECTTPDSAYYKEMVISQQVVIEATKEVERFRHVHKSRVVRSFNGAADHPQLESYTFRSKHESESIHSLKLPSRSQSFWTPINGDDSYHPMANLAPIIVYEARGPNVVSRFSPGSTFTNRPSSKQYVDPFLDALPRIKTGEPQQSLAEKWRPKRRRRVYEDCRNACPPATAAMDIDAEERKPEQELDHLKAAAVLLSLQQETQELNRCCTAVMDPSDNDSPGGPRQKKRPKAHSF